MFLLSIELKPFLLHTKAWSQIELNDSWSVVWQAFKAIQQTKKESKSSSQTDNILIYRIRIFSMVKIFVILTVENTNTRGTSAYKPYFLLRHGKRLSLPFLPKCWTEIQKLERGLPNTNEGKNHSWIIVIR